MRLFAKVAEHKSFTAAARELDVPKQTLSRRIAELERALGERLMHRTTRRLVLTDVGAAYAERCAEIVRIAAEANHAVADAHDTPRGLLRISADPVFGEAFVSGLVVDYAARWKETRVEVALTRRLVDLIEERFDVAFRVGHVDDPALSGVKLGPARIRYCASPSYLKRKGVPKRPEDLNRHDCVAISDGGPVKWPLPQPISVVGRLTVSSFAMARDAVVAGLGIGIFPEFACADAIARKRLVSIFEPVDVGSIWLLHVARRFVPARVRAFVDLARERFAKTRW